MRFHVRWANLELKGWNHHSYSDKCDPWVPRGENMTCNRKKMYFLPVAVGIAPLSSGKLCFFKPENWKNEDFKGEIYPTKMTCMHMTFSLDSTWLPYFSFSYEWQNTNDKFGTNSALQSQQAITAYVASCCLYRAVYTSLNKARRVRLWHFKTVQYCKA